MDIYTLVNLPYVFLTQSYWRDEAFRILLSKYSLIDIIRLTYNDGQPPLHYYILKLWTSLFGDSEIATRTLSLIFFEILLFSIYLFARKIKPGTRIFPAIAFLLALVNPSLVYYAFEARVYMMFTLLTTLSFYFWYRKKYKTWVLFSLLGLYSHNFMVFVIFTQGIWMILVNKDIKNFIKSTLLIFAGYLPWAGVLLHQAKIVFSDFWVAPFGSGQLGVLLGGLYTGYENDQAKLYTRFVLLSAALAGICLMLVFRKHGKFLLWWIIGSVIPVILVSLTFRSIYTTRYLGYLAVPLVLMVGLAVDGQKNKIIKSVMLVAAVLTSLYFNQLLFPFRLKTDFKSSVIKLLGMVHKEDMVYTTSLNYFETNYYFEKLIKSGYTMEAPIKLYSKTGTIPNFVGKVLIKDENIVSKIPADKRIFAINDQGRITIYSRFR